MRAAAYIRVSTEEQVEGFSLAAQSRAIRAYCELQGWQLVGEYVDEGLSASKESSAQRPEFRRILAAVEAGEVDVVIVHKLDRFSRLLTLTIQSLARIYAAGASFVSLSEHIDYTTPQGKLMLGLFAAFAQFYSDNLSTETTKGHRERAQQGLWNGDLPFGYEKAGGKGGSARVAPVVVPAEAELVRGAFQLYAGGTVSTHQVAEWLNDQGARPRSRRADAVHRFTKATARDMLGNPFYGGRLRYHDEVLPGQHEAIVSWELFEAVQRTLTERRTLGAAVRRRHSHTYLLRGLGRCVSCGELLWCSPATTGARYRDASKLKQRPCGAHRTSVTVEAIDQQVGQLVRRMVLPDDWRERVTEYMGADGDAAAANAKRARIRDRLGRMKDLYLMGDMRRGEYEIERAKLRAELDAMDAAESVVQPAAEAGEMLGRLARLWDVATPERQAELAQSVFAEVWIDLDAGRVEYVRPRPQFKPLFDVLRTERVVSGDPERSRVNHTQLFAPILELVEMGALYVPAQLGVA